MTGDKSPAAQLETLWRRFATADPVVLGVAAACAMVVAADQRVALLEVLRFAQIFRAATERHPAPTPLPDDAFGRMATDFQDLATLFVGQPAEGNRQALSVIKKFKGDAARRETILLAAKAAVSADGTTDPRESTALGQIADALGFES
jgi:tellurite resistance protein